MLNKYLEKIAANRLGREAIKKLLPSIGYETEMLKTVLPKTSQVPKASLMDRVKHYARDMQGYGGEFVEKRADITPGMVRAGLLAGGAGLGIAAALGYTHRKGISDTIGAIKGNMSRYYQIREHADNKYPDLTENVYDDNDFDESDPRDFDIVQDSKGSTIAVDYHHLNDSKTYRIYHPDFSGEDSQESKFPDHKLVHLH